MSRDASRRGLTGLSGTVGVLALQGGFEAHRNVLSALGASVREVRVPADLANLSGLVLPGGESTTMMFGIEREGLAEPLREFVGSGAPVLATCAGSIILDDTHLGLLDATCDRNAYGGQIHSFETDLQIDGIRGVGTLFRGVFIRAPRFVRVGPDARTIALLDGEPVALRAGSVTATSFHPELTDDDRVHRMFLEDVSAARLNDINNRKKRAA